MVDAPRDDDRELTEEELLLFEIAEHSRLRAIGINPDGDPVDIMVELDKRLQAYKKRNAEDGE
jgi:hypothetical protein